MSHRYSHRASLSKSGNISVRSCLNICKNTHDSFTRGPCCSVRVPVGASFPSFPRYSFPRCRHPHNLAFRGLNSMSHRYSHRASLSKSGNIFVRSCLNICKNTHDSFTRGPCCSVRVPVGASCLGQIIAIGASCPFAVKNTTRIFSRSSKCSVSRYMIV